LRSPGRALDLADLRAMCLVSGGTSLAFGLLFLGTVVSFLVSAGPMPRDTASGVAAGLFLTGKASVELSAALRLGKVPRVPLAALSFGEGFVAFARGWLMSFWLVLVLTVLHLVWAAVCLAFLALGMLVVLMVLVVTLGTRVKEAHKKVFAVLDVLCTPFELELRALDFLWSHPLGVLLLALVVGAFTLGPTVAAVVLHRKTAGLRASGVTRVG
jgi:hypothetical protein